MRNSFQQQIHILKAFIAIRMKQAGRPVAGLLKLKKQEDKQSILQSIMKAAYKKVQIATLIIITCMLQTACNTAKRAAACPDNVACTMMFTSISVYVTDTNTSPILLDDAYTINVSTGETIHLEANGAGMGHYTVLDDSYRKKLQNRTDRFQFVGIKNNQRIVEELYTISADCCHISKVSGRNEVVIR